MTARRGVCGVLCHAGRLMLVAALSLPVLPASDLDFPVRHLAATPKPGDRAMDFSFAFTNRGVGPVTITDIRTGCGCLVAPLEKRTFAPGESGTIPVTFTIGSAFGLQQKTIHVSTTDPDHRVIALTIEVKLPDGPVITPRFLGWDQDGPAETKSSELVIPADATWRIVRAYDSKGHFTVSLVPSPDDPRKATVLVTPQQTARPATGAIVIATDTGAAFHIYAQVKPGAAGR
jgi:hypothetical protein